MIASAPGGREPAARFVTFYSYKGGVGRSMALANVAAWLVTEAHKRVVAVDFDLEAPGLAYYFARSGLLGDRALPAPGLVELLTRYRTDGTVPDLSDYVLDGPAQIGGGRLHLLCAGEHHAPSYAPDLAALDWNALYESGFGFELMEHLRVSLIDGYRPDVVLIDSRTVLHGIGAIAAQQLPDSVVLLFSLNEQNVDGTARVLRDIEENVFGTETGRAIHTVLVASPVYEPGLPEAADAIDRAEETFGRPVDARVPFSSAAVYGEQVWRVGDRDAPQSLLLEYARIGRLLSEDDEAEQRPPASGDDTLSARLFELQGFAVRPPDDPRVRVDFVASKDDLLGATRMGVAVVPGTGRGQAGLVTEARKQLKRGGLDSTLLVTTGAPTKVLQAAAAKEAHVSVVGMPDLLDRFLDWRGYLHWLADETAEAGWAEHLGRLRVTGWPDPPPHDEPADRWLIERWLHDDVPLLVLVGPRDAGRSTLSRWLAHDLAQGGLTREHVTDGRLPVLLPLASYRRELEVDALLTDLLADRRHFARRPAPVDRLGALHLLGELGRLVFIVEEVDTLPDPRAAMREIARLAGPKAKVLINRYVDSPAAIDVAGLPRHHLVTFSARETTKA
jgi:hypothetical protein